MNRDRWRRAACWAAVAGGLGTVLGTVLFDRAGKGSEAGTVLAIAGAVVVFAGLMCLPRDWWNRP